MSKLPKHWKNMFDYKYLGAYSLQAIDKTDLTVTIKHIYNETVKNNVGKEETFLFCSFNELEKPMILNKTNCKTIAKLYTPDMNEWIGKPITLYATKAKLMGDMVDALRIRAFVPQIKNLDVSAEKVKLQECKTKEQLKQVYKTFSQQAQKELKQFVIDLSKKLA